jgi:hypothetical protein
MQAHTSIRGFLSDGFNSFAHVTLGYLSNSCDAILPIFLIYQLAEKDQENTFIDLSEFVFGIFLEKTTRIKL